MLPQQESHEGGTGELRIRSLARSDLARVLDIERRGYSHPWTEAVFRDCFRDNYRLWAGCRGDRLVGYAVVAYMFDEAHLLNLCVDPEWQGRGFARVLLQHLLSEAEREQIWQTILEVRISNDAAYRLYSGAGFEEIGRRPDYYPGAVSREDARVMALRFER